MDSEQTIPDSALTPITSSGSLSTNGVDDEVIISAIKVNKYFGDKHVLKDVDFEVRKKEVVALIGPSGSGKSTLLRCFNGLEKHTSGEIYIDGQKLDPRLSNKQLSPIRSELGMVFQNFNLGKSTLLRCFNGLEKHTSGEIYIHGQKLDPRLSNKQLSPIRSELGMVFQNFNLFPHMTVLYNIIEAPLLVRKMPKDQAVALAEQLLAKVGLEEKRDVYPNRLSGGQKQRVAIARALAMQPRALLFDVSDRVVFISDGVIVEQGDPQELFKQPRHERTKLFLERVLSTLL